VSIQPASEPVTVSVHVLRDAPPADDAEPVAAADPNDVALEFVRFCYRRRRVNWPALYDEMSAVAARGVFRGMGYGELAEHGVSFYLGDLPRLVALTELVIGEEATSTEPRPGMATLTLAPANS
jgi:hypothetical protein